MLMVADEVVAATGSGDGAQSEPEPSQPAQPPRIHVVRLRPGSWFWWCFPFILLALAGIGYMLGVAATPRVGNAERTAQLQEDFSLDRMSEMRDELTALRMSQVVDGGAAEEMQQNFRALQDKTAALEEEVAFYRSLMRPEELERGLHIEKMIMSDTALYQTFGYELVVAQAVARHSWQEGELYFEVHGVRDNQREVLALTAVSIHI